MYILCRWNFWIIIFNNSVRSPKKTQDMFITKNNWLILFKEIIFVHSEKHKKVKLQSGVLLVLKVDGTYS
jgi:hypothetical protein